jgi:hypothetical protein
MPRARPVSGTSASAIPSAGQGTSFESPVSAFPVSAHGVHSRRASGRASEWEKERDRDREGRRRSLEAATFSVPFLPVGSGCGEDSVNGSLASLASSPIIHEVRGTASGVGLWRKPMLSCVMEIDVERGGWDVCSKRIIGVRRRLRGVGIASAKERVQTHAFGQRKGKETEHGLTAATLERWELWSFEPSSGRVHTSVLAALNCNRSSKLKEKGKSLNGDDRVRDEEEKTLPSRLSTSSVSSSSSGMTTASTRSSISSLGRSTMERIAAVIPMPPRLPFTRVSPVLSVPSSSSTARLLAGFGNTLGVFEVEES